MPNFQQNINPMVILQFLLVSSFFQNENLFLHKFAKCYIHLVTPLYALYHNNNFVIISFYTIVDYNIIVK